MGVITIANQKGGVGKSTIAIHLADCLQRAKNRVLIIDADPQGSALDWKASREEDGVPVVGLPKPNIHKEIGSLKKNYDFIIVDGPPRIEKVLRSAIKASDLIIIPVQPSAFDIWSAKDVLEIVEEEESSNLKTFFLINRKIVSTTIGEEAKIALKEYNYPVFNTHICQRVVFAETASHGQTCFDVEPKGKASEEILKLMKEVRRVLK